MHSELELLKSHFLTCGYPRWLIDQKIKLTLDKMLGAPPENNIPRPAIAAPPADRNYKPRWTVLHIPWCGKKADQEPRK